MCFCLPCVKAQDGQKTYRVYGVVVDSATRKPVEGATVYLLDDSSRTLKTAVGKNGSFSFSALQPLAYNIRITAVGHGPKTIAARLNGSKEPEVNLGIIYLPNTATSLSEVTVKATRRVIKQEVDRLVYDLEADPESKGSSVLDMMRKVPYLSVDGDNNLLLNGGAGYRVFINGKPSALVERNPRDILRSMPASTIKSIEVITNPPAKYDAEGLTGIINIVTYKKADDGYNGTVNLSHKFPAGGPNAGGAFSLKSGKTGFSIVAGASVYNTPAQQSINLRNTFGDNATGLEQLNSRETDTRNGYVASEVSYDVDSLNLMAAQLNFSANGADNLTRRHATLTVKNGALQAYGLTNTGDGNGNGFDAALNYQRGFKRSKDKLLTLSYRYLRNENKEYDAIDIFDTINFKTPDYNQLNKGAFSEQTLQVDYVQSSRRLLVEAGAKVVFRNNESDYQLRSYDNDSKDFKLDVNHSNNFTNNQDILALYNGYQYQWKTWGFKAGLRLERTSTDARFISNNTKVAQQYLNLIPSAALVRKFKNAVTLNLNYTNRIQRPSIYQLNPFVDRTNPNIESSGNPNLKTGFTNIIQVSYTQSQKGFLNVALAYMLLDDILNPVSAYDPATAVTRTTYENVGKARILKTNIAFNYPLKKDWALRFNSDFRYIRARFLVGRYAVDNHGGNAFANLATNYCLKNGWRFNGDITVNSGGISGIQSKTNSYVASSFGAQKDLAKGRITLSATVTNPIAKYRTVRDEVVAADFTQLTRNDIYFRSFSMSLNYRFGKLKEAIKKNKRNINNDDVELK